MFQSLDGEWDTETIAGCEKLKLGVYNSLNGFFSPLFLIPPLAFQYGEQICFSGWNERLQVEPGGNAGALFKELQAEGATICDQVAVRPPGPSLF